MPDLSHVRARSAPVTQKEYSYIPEEVPALTQNQVEHLTENLQLERRETLSFIDRFLAFFNLRKWRTVRVLSGKEIKLVYFDVRRVIDSLGKNHFQKTYPCTNEAKRENNASFNVDGLRGYITRQKDLAKQIKIFSKLPELQILHPSKRKQS